MRSITSLCLIVACCLFTACGEKKEEEKSVNPRTMVISDELSNQGVTAFAEDSLGYIWIGTERGLNRYNGHDYHQYFHNDEDITSLPSNNITSLFVDRDARLWVGTADGLCYYTPQGDFHRVYCDQQYKNVHQIFQDRQGRIVVNLIEQLCVYQPDDDQLHVVIKKFDPEKAYINECFQDSAGNYWSVIRNSVRRFNGETFELEKSIETGIRPHNASMLQNGELWLSANNQLYIIDITDGEQKPVPAILEKMLPFAKAFSLTNQKHLIVSETGMLLYDSETNQIIHQDDAQFPLEAPQSGISLFFLDSHKNLWTGYRTQGVSVSHQANARFNSIPHLSKAFRQNPVISMSTDSQGHTWLMTFDNRLYHYSAEGKVTLIDTRGCLEKAVPNALPNSVMADNSGRLWMLNNERLIEATTDGNTIGRYTIHNEFKRKVFTLAKGSDGTIWCGSSGGYIYYLKPGDDSFREMRIEADAMTLTYRLLPLHDGNIISSISFTNPVLMNPKTGESKRIPVWGNSSDVVMKLVTSLCEDAKGIVWIGTRGSGLFRYVPKYNKVEKVEGLYCEEICDIETDREGNVWVSTLNGLCKYDSKSHTVTNYDTNDGIAGNQFCERSSTKLADGTILFGGTHGLTAFDPARKQQAQKTTLIFEDLIVHNQVARPGEDGYLETSLAYQPKVRLGHEDNNFTVSFVALDYQGNAQAHYQYLLEGYNKQWVDVGSSQSAYFSNVPAGKHLLKVRVTGKGQSVAETESQLEISVAPSPWNTWWAWCLYLLLVGGIAYVMIQTRLRAIKEKRIAERLEQEKAQEQRLNQINMSFFANISHEFRTPLTMISAPITQLSRNALLSDRDKSLINTIRWNTNRMLRLVNQLMDFNKLENDALKLQVKPYDVIDLLRQTIGASQISIAEKGITLRMSGFEDSFHAVIDPDKLDKVVSNLMSNALKYTPKDGTISCKFDVIGGQMVITVANSGPAIPEDKLEKIFERYYQVENHRNYGTGIGLYFARRLMQLHHGAIKAENLEGGGVMFTVTLSASDIYSAEEHATEGSIEQLRAYPIQDNATEVQAEVITDDDHQQTVMVVDDDPSIVNYLKQLLSPHYNIRYAYDAEAALDTIREEAPDIVLSDVAMPKKDGFQLCQDIKTDRDICHIPVILITAKTTMDEQITGLRIGADAYITKPFDPDYLLAMIRSQLSNRERIRGIISNATSTEEIEQAEENILTPQDKVFMDELYALMEKNLNDSDLNINRMTEVLHISRSKFYYKIKGLTGEKPNVFFRKYKLNRAAELLKKGEYNISEVAYMTGFSSPTIFSRNFKAEFGITPTEFINQ